MTLEQRQEAIEKLKASLDTLSEEGLKKEVVRFFELYLIFDEENKELKKKVRSLELSVECHEAQRYGEHYTK